MILSNITVPLLGLVDTAVIGHLEQAYFLGGSTVGAMLITAITWLCGFLRMSTTGLSAQAYGACDKQQGLIILMRGLLVALLIAAIMLLLQGLYLDIGLSLAGGSEQVQYYARQYAEIRIWGLPAALANLVILGWLLGNHQAKTVMVLLIITNLINLVLDLVFVLGLGWQVRGVALATLVAEYSGLILGLVVITRSKIRELKLLLQDKLWFSLLTRRAALMEYFKLNRDILIRTLCLELCFIFMTFQGARLGDDIVAANAILMNFLLLISFGLDGIANAAEVMVGRAKGAGDGKKLKLVVNISLVWSALFALVYSLAFAAGGPFFITLISDIPSVVAEAGVYFSWIIFLPLLSCWCYLYDGVYIGLMQAKAMRNSMLLATFACFFPMWWLLQDYGNHGLWAAFSVFMLMRGVSLAWHFHIAGAGKIIPGKAEQKG
ncbi:MATE family efflux transporter [Thalassomonas viridans]|uniref:MATE family efflux transporter n=1 Tax=Thalassomonas viridans TaxID=137584 RepID=A0AAE9Z7B5_9GAMM|nr:MATE family efflux transporter [Thalassomonas viridans]WDE08096.1 MATE family efflux transporter [Thalassomonas viridans]